MAVLGDYVWVYWLVGTQYGDAGEVTGEEFTNHIGQLVSAGYGTLTTRPPGPGTTPPSNPNAMVSRDYVDRRLAEAKNAADAAYAPAGGVIPELPGGAFLPGQELGFAVYTHQFTATSASWETIPGFELALPTGDRPVYFTLDMGLVAVEGVTARATSVSYRILDLDRQMPLLSGYVTAVRRNTVDANEYLLVQSSPITVRVNPNQPLVRYIVQVQVPNDQTGPAWYFNVEWAEGIELTLKAVTA